MKTVIYLDVLLLVNFLIAYFLLMATGLLSAQRADFGRMLVASGAAALSALVIFAPELPYGFQLGYKLATAAVIVALAFGVRGPRRYLAGVCWYAALNLLLAGLCILAVVNTRSPLVQTGNLTVYLRISPLLLLVLSAFCCVLVRVVLQFMESPAAPAQTVGLEMELAGTTLRLRARLDTGCHLKDPVTCLPVLLISYPNARSRLPESVCEFLDSWYAGRRETDPPEGTPLRLIPCRTAAEQTLLPGFAVGQIGIIRENGVLALGRTAVAFSPQAFEDGAYEALYGSEFL